MKKLFLLSLIILSSYAYAQNDQTQTSTTPCWGAKLYLEADYMFENNFKQELQTSYTAKEIEGIYQHILLHDRTFYGDQINRQFMCSLLWPYFTFIMKGSYELKDFTSATTAFIEALGSDVFITKLNSLDKKLKILPILEGFNGKNKANDNANAYKKFAEDSKNLILINLMNSNENLFLSLKTYLNDKKATSLKDITVDDLFNLLIYLNGKQYLDTEYFSRLDSGGNTVSYFDKETKYKGDDGNEGTYYDAYAAKVLTELKKIEN